MEDPEDYEGEFDFEAAGYEADWEEDDAFEEEYEKIFADGDVEEDTGSYKRDAVTGRKAKRPRMAALNKSDLSDREMDELFLEH